MRIKLSLIMLLFASSPVFAKGGADLRWPVQDRGKMGTPPVLLLWGPIAESNHELHANWRHGVLGEAIVEIVQDPASHLPQEYISRFSRYMRLAYNNDNKEMTNTWSAAMDYGRTPGAWGQMATAIRIQLASEGNVLRQGEWYELALKLKPEGVSQKSFILEGYLLMQEADDGAGIAQWYQYHLTPPTPCEAVCLKQEFKKAIVELLTHPPGWKEAELATLNYQEFGTTPIDWKGQDLREIDLRDRELQGLDFSSANLEGKDLRGKNLSKAKLQKANLKKANLEKVNLSDANLTQAVLTNANLKDANLEAANFTLANLIGADLDGAKLGGIQVAGAKLAGVNLAGGNLSEQDLQGMDFTKTNLSKANLRKANLQNAKFLSTDLSQADLGNANLTQAVFTNANLEDANLESANFTQADLIGADLDGAKLGVIQVKGAKLAGVNLAGVNLSEQDLQGLDFTKTNLSKANLVV